MSLLKFVDRIHRIDYLLKREHTGNSKEFAARVGISRSMLMENLREMKELGAEIEYSVLKRSYYYKKEFIIIIGNSDKIKGGQNVANFLTQSHGTGPTGYFSLTSQIDSPSMPAWRFE